MEDSPTALYTLQSILEESGFEVHTAGDGLSALSSLSRVRPDLIMLDIGLPGIDGISLCATIRRRTEFDHVPIFVVTGSGRTGDRNLSGLFGAQAYITKPYAADTIVQMVSQFLSTSTDINRQS